MNGYEKIASKGKVASSIIHKFLCFQDFLNAMLDDISPKQYHQILLDSPLMQSV